MSHAITSFPGIAGIHSLPTEITSRSVFVQFYIQQFKKKKKRKKGIPRVGTHLRIPSICLYDQGRGTRFEPAGSKLNRVNPSKLGPAGTDACVRVLRWHGSLENWINIRAGCRDKFHREFRITWPGYLGAPRPRISSRKTNASIENSPLHARAKNLRVESINERVYFRRGRREQGLRGELKENIEKWSARWNIFG